MKRIFSVIFASVVCMSTQVSAMNYYQALRNQCVQFGETIGKTDNVPLVGKLTNLLPFAVVATCFKECPGQTMAMLTGLVLYVLSHSNSVRSALRKYNIFNTRRSAQVKPIYDDSLFIFAGEDAEDAQEEEDDEEDLLSGGFDEMRKKKNARV